MFSAAHEWTLPGDTAPGSAALPERTQAPYGPAHPLYHRLAGGLPDEAARNDATAFVRQALQATQADDSGLPGSPHDLAAWMHDSAQRVGARYPPVS